MIQRIQTVYLLVVTIILALAMFLPIGQFVALDGITTSVFKPLGISLGDGSTHSTWGLFVLLLLSTLIAFITIFFFRKRMLQVRMTIFNSLLLLGYYIAVAVFVFMLKDELAFSSFQLRWALCLPAIAIILNYLAFRAIYRDELLVKAADRLR